MPCLEEQVPSVEIRVHVASCVVGHLAVSTEELVMVSAMTSMTRAAISLTQLAGEAVERRLLAAAVRADEAGEVEHA